MKAAVWFVIGCSSLPLAAFLISQAYDLVHLWIYGFGF